MAIISSSNSILVLSLLNVFMRNAKCTRHPDGYSYRTCLPSETVCRYWLVIQEKLTMVFHGDLVYAEKGKLYKYDELPQNYTTEIPVDQVVTADGVNRMLEAVNGTLPGPPIVVYEGQTLIIHIKNLLLSTSATIHFHGLHQRDTSYFDGMPYITQCPIHPGQTFTHKFKASPRGTFWYHSHIGAQRSNGVYGPLIIKQRFPPRITPPQDMIMTVGDYHHEDADEVYVKMIYGNFIGRHKYETTGTLDGGHFSGVPWVSALINGKGRYKDALTGKVVMAPLAWFNVTKGALYRFRVIGVGSIYPMRISVDKHLLIMIASDGYDFEPLVAESFIINPGERYDFLLRATQEIGNYWVRAESMEHNVKDHTVEAVLHYEGAEDKEPNTTRQECLPQKRCKILNCPFDFFPEEYNIDCVKISEMKSTINDEPMPPWEDDSEEYFLNFAFPGQKITPGSVNGRKFEYPGVNSLFQSSQVGQMQDYDCGNHECGDDKICYCHYEITVPYNKTIQMVWLNMGIGSGWAHPIHLHGHTFHVVKMEYASHDNVTGKLLQHTQDIDCGGGLNFCNSAKWRHPSWENGNLPGLNLYNAVRKDTIIVPTGGYVVIRIRSDNPGKWFLHCHIEVHALDGMGMVLNEAPEKPLLRPPGFPVCTSFYDDHSRDIDYYENVPQESVVPSNISQPQFLLETSTSECASQPCPNKDSLIVVVSSTLGAIILLQLLVIFSFLIPKKPSCKQYLPTKK